MAAVEAGARSTYRPDVVYDAVIVLGNDPYGNPVRTKNVGRITPEGLQLVRRARGFAPRAIELGRQAGLAQNLLDLPREPLDIVADAASAEIAEV